MVATTPGNQLSAVLFANQVRHVARRFRVEQGVDRRALSRLRTIFGFYATQPCRFAGSPAAPIGDNCDVRYESLDFQYRRAASITAGTAQPSMKQRARMEEEAAAAAEHRRKLDEVAQGLRLAAPPARSSASAASSSSSQSEAEAGSADTASVAGAKTGAGVLQGQLQRAREEEQRFVTTTTSLDAMRLHRIHHISGFISSIFVAEYRRPSHGFHAQTHSLFLSVNDAMHKRSQDLFMLDSGTVTDVTRVETALRHALRCPDADPAQDPNWVAEKIGLVHCTHAHCDHCAAGTIWAKRGVPVTVVPGMQEHFNGFGGKVQFVIETLGANFYAWYLRRRFPEWTFFNPRRLRPQAAGMESTPSKPSDTKNRKESASQSSDNGDNGSDGAVAEGMYRRLAIRELGPGEAVPVAPFSDWCSLHVPGHTVHMNVLYHALSRTIYVADMFQFQFGKFRPPIPVDRLDCYLRSLEMLRDLPVKYLLMPHGGIMELRCDEADAELAEMAKRDERARAVIELMENARGSVTNSDKIAGEEEEEEQVSAKKQSDNNKKPARAPIRAADSATMNLDEYLAELSRTRKQPHVTFRDICNQVADKAKAQAAASSDNASSGSKNSGVVVTLVKKLTKNSPAPPKFDWTRDLMLPEEQLERTQQHIKNAAAIRERDGAVFAEHRYRYRATDQPVD